MQDFRKQQGQLMAPAIDYLNQVHSIYFDSWRRCCEAGVRLTRDAIDECNRIGQDMLHLVSDAQVALSRNMAEQAGEVRNQGRDQAQHVLQAQHEGERRDGAHDKHEGRHEKREGGAEKREGAARGKGGQDNASTVHQRAGA